MTTEDVVKELIKTADLFGVALTETRISGYLEALAGEDPDELCVALQTIRQTGKFFPRPTEITDTVYGHVDELAELAWEYLRNDPRDKVPCPSLLQYDAPAVAMSAGLDVVGGRRMLTGEAELRQVPYLHRQFTATFTRVYKRELAQSLREAKLKALPGRQGPKALI